MKMKNIKDDMRKVTKDVPVTVNPTPRETNLDQIEYWEKKLEDMPDFDPARYKIPAMYHDCSLDNYRGAESLIKRLRHYAGGSLVLSGNTGSGKTHLAIALMRELEQKQYINQCERSIKLLKEGKDVLKYWHLRPEKCFIAVPNLLLEIRASFREGSSESEEQIIKKYSNVPMLVLDDLGSEKVSDFVLTTLYILINNRYAENMDTIITTNRSLEQIEDHLNARIASRMASMDLVKISMSDYRKQEASLDRVTD